MTKRERRLINELQLVTGVLTDDIPYLCFLLLKDGTYFKEVKTEDEKEEEAKIEEIKQKVSALGSVSFEELLKSI